MHFLKKYWQEIVAFLDLELFLWAAMRRYWDAPPDRMAAMALDAVIMVSGISLVILVWRLSKKWRRRRAEQLRELSRKWFRRLSERVMEILERLQRLRGRDAHDILTGRTRIDFDLYGDRAHRGKRRRVSWKQLESERDRLRWLYAAEVESKLKHGAVVRPSDTPTQVSAREDNTPEQVELFEMYSDYRYDSRREPPEGAATEWRARNGSGR